MQSATMSIGIERFDTQTMDIDHVGCFSVQIHAQMLSKPTSTSVRGENLQNLDPLKHGLMGKISAFTQSTQQKQLEQLNLQSPLPFRT